MRVTPGEHAQLEPPLAELATRQHGVVSIWQLRGLGYTKQQIETLIAAGHLIRLRRGVYAVGHRRLTAKGRWMAAVLRCGDGARLSHLDAAALWDLRRVPSGLIHVTAARPRRVPGVRCHCTRHPERLGDTEIDAIPVTSLERMFHDVAATLPAQRLRALLEAAERRQLLDAGRITAEIEANHGRRGTTRLATALSQVADAPPELRSGLEARFLELVRAAGLPEPATNVIVAGVPVDAHWPQYDLVVEVDGWDWHRSRRSFEDDREKANTLQLAGQTVLRFADTAVATAPAQIRRAIAAAAA